MIGGIGKGDNLARAAIESALKRQSESLQNIQERAASIASSASPHAPDKASFEDPLNKSVQAVDKHAQTVEQLHLDLLEGKLDVHEVAAQLQQSKLAFDFALQVRDRFVDAYREVMRMSL